MASIQTPGGGVAGEVSVTDVGDDPIVVEPPIDLERGTVLAGRYQIEAYVGKGGSGVVLRAFDRITQTPVALKVLSQELASDPHWGERFSRELRLGRQIQHPNVCRVFDIGESDGHRFLSMELATKGTLRAAIRAEPRPFAEKVADARALVSGLAALHAAGIIHRDVKPENLLRMEDGRIVLSDFGLATNPTQTAAVTVLVGTPSYMAPEIVMGDPASFRSDVWALGVTMHEILFGKRPEWDVVDGERKLRMPVGKGASRLERTLAAVCAACAAEHADQRPVNAIVVASLLTPGRE
ncbi:MAG TPA: serine/threonine-protein kinase, partial [Polyangia bacterium]